MSAHQRRLKIMNTVEEPRSAHHTWWDNCFFFLPVCQVLLLPPLLPPLLLLVLPPIQLLLPLLPWSMIKLLTSYESQNYFNLFDFAIKANAEGQIIVNGVWFEKKKRKSNVCVMSLKCTLFHSSTNYCSFCHNVVRIISWWIASDKRKIPTILRKEKNNRSGDEVFKKDSIHLPNCSFFTSIILPFFLLWKNKANNLTKAF